MSAKKEKRKAEKGEKSKNAKNAKKIHHKIMKTSRWMDLMVLETKSTKKGIGLRGYGQKDPATEYRLEGSEMFEQMIDNIKTDVVKILLNVHKSGELRRKETVEITNASQQNLNNLDNDTVNKEPIKNEGPKVGRNDPCPCGSGKKYKNCCGK